MSGIGIDTECSITAGKTERKRMKVELKENEGAGRIGNARSVSFAHWRLYAITGFLCL